MSLINDALKRASQTDKNRASPASAPPARMVPASGEPLRMAPWVLGVVILVVLALAGWFFWQWHNASRPSPVAIIAPARPAAPAPQTPPPQKMEPTPPPPAKSVAVVAPPIQKAAPPPAPVPPPWPEELTLKGIFFSKSNPRALINDRTVWRGDIIDGITVSEIQPDRVIVEWHGQKKELMLEAP